MSWWTDQTSPLFLMILLFPVVNLKEFDILVKLNMVGVASILYLLTFIPSISFVENKVQIEDVKQVNSK
jgi:hypothetical protein